METQTEAVIQAKRLGQIREENLNTLYDILKDHPDIKKLKPEDESIKIDVTIGYEADAEEFKLWADDVYQLLTKHPTSTFDIDYVSLDGDDGYKQPTAFVKSNQKESQEDFEKRVERELRHKLWSLFSNYTKSKYGIDIFAFDLFLKDMLKLSVDEFVNYLKELRDSEWNPNSN